MSLFKTRKQQHQESIEQRYAAAVAAFDDARGVIRYGLSARQYKRQRFLIRVADAGLDPLRVAFTMWLIDRGRLGRGDFGREGR